MLLPDERTKQQMLGVIRQLIGEQEVPLDTLECDAVAREVTDEVLALVRWNLWCRTRRSTTFW